MAVLLAGTRVALAGARDFSPRDCGGIHAQLRPRSDWARGQAAEPRGLAPTVASRPVGCGARGQRRGVRAASADAWTKRWDHRLRSRGGLPFSGRYAAALGGRAAQSGGAPRGRANGLARGAHHQRRHGPRLIWREWWRVLKRPVINPPGRHPSLRQVGRPDVGRRDGASAGVPCMGAAAPFPTRVASRRADAAGMPTPQSSLIVRKLIVAERTRGHHL